VRPPEEHRSRYYLRMTVDDRPGVLARIAQALGDAQISIASFIQYEVEGAEGAAELVFTTHHANGGALRAAIGVIESLDVVHEIGNVLPMAGEETLR
jgi:homoserine dehydrogenase